MEQGDNGRVATPTLQIADVLLAEARQFGQAFLLDGFGLANPLEVSSNEAPHVHDGTLAEYTLEGLSSLRVVLLTMDHSSFQDSPPDPPHLTPYDEMHLEDYLRLLDAAAEDADWREAVLAIFGIDAALEPERARMVHRTHLARARWMTEVGYAYLLGPRYH